MQTGEAAETGIGAATEQPQPAAAAAAAAEDNAYANADGDYQKLKRLIRYHFYHRRLNVRRAEVYLRGFRQLKLYRELLVYVLFMAVFFGLVLVVLPAGAAFEHSAQFAGAGALLDVIQLGSDNSAFLAMNTPDDFYGWIKGKMLDVLAPENISALYLRPVGLMRLRQVRNAPLRDGCRSDPEGLVDALFDPDAECYPPYAPVPSSTTEQRAPFVGRVSEMLYKWKEERSELLASWTTIRDTGYSSSYGWGGYSVDLDTRDTLGASARIDQLVDDGFIDDSTRAVALGLALYNRHTGLYVAMEFFAEIPPSGLLVPTYRVRTLRLEMLEDKAQLFFAALFFLFVAVYAVNEFLELQRRGVITYFSESWNIVEILALVMFAVMIAYVAKFFEECRYVHNEMERDPLGQYINFQHARLLAETVNELAGINVLLTAVRVFKFVRLNPNLSIVWTTLSKARKDLFYFVAVFLIVFAGYAFMGHIIFGYQVPRYHNFTSSFASLFRFIGGDSEYEGLNSASPVSGIIFFFTFIVFVTFVLVNIFIAIVGKHYGDACDEAEAIRTELADLQAKRENLSSWQLFLRYEVFAIAHPEPSDGKLAPRKNGTVLRLWFRGKPSKPEEQKSKQQQAGNIPKQPSSTTHRVMQSLHTVAIEPDLHFVIHGKEPYKRFVFQMLEKKEHAYLEYPDRDASGKSKKKPRVRIEVLDTRTDEEGQYASVTLCYERGAKCMLDTLMCLRLSWTSSIWKLALRVMFPSLYRLSSSRILFDHYGLGERKKQSKPTAQPSTSQSQTVARGPNDPERGLKGNETVRPATTSSNENRAPPQHVIDRFKALFSTWRVISALKIPESAISQHGFKTVLRTWATIFFGYDRKLREEEVETLIMEMAKSSREFEKQRKTGEEFLQSFRLEHVLTKLREYDVSWVDKTRSGFVAVLVRAAVRLDALLHLLRRCCDKSEIYSEPGTAPVEGTGVQRSDSDHSSANAAKAAEAQRTQSGPSSIATSFVRGAPSILDSDPTSSGNDRETSFAFSNLESELRASMPYLNANSAPSSAGVAVSLDPQASFAAPAPMDPAKFVPLNPLLANSWETINTEKERFDLVTSLYHECLNQADELQRGLEDLRMARLNATPAREAVRFDELCAQISMALAKRDGPGTTTGAEVKREAVHILSFFPLECFDLLNEREEIKWYRPRPKSIDSDEIANTDRDPMHFFKPLLEQIGTVIHDNWALGKLKNDFFLGKKKNEDRNKNKGRLEHPKLVPFESLLHWERDTDKNMFISGLRSVVALGYTIIAPEDSVEDTEKEELQSLLATPESARSALDAKARAKLGMEPMPENAQFHREKRINGDYVLQWIPITENDKMPGEWAHLNDSLAELVDLMAEATHDTWAFNRKAEGLRWGPEIVEGKKHNLLKPYGLMTDEERRPDVSTVEMTLRIVLKLGYRIEFKRPSLAARLLRRIFS